MSWRVQTLLLWALVLLGILSLDFVVGVVTALFPGAEPRDQLAAAAAVLGGLIGAAGVALAVYLTLASQRSDEVEKIESALRMEVSEFARLASGQLEACELVLVKGYRIPLRDLPGLVQIPEAVVFRATADRISRLSHGPLFVVFYARIAEAVQMARIYAATVPPPPPAALGERAAAAYHLSEPAVLDFDRAKTLATAWFDVCELAYTILTRDPRGSRLAEEAAAAVVKAIEQVNSRMRPQVRPASDE